MSDKPIRIVGRRTSRPEVEPESLEGFFRLGAALRPTPWLVPRGVYRFATFEEAQEWMDREILRTLKRSSPAPPASRT